MLPMIASHCFGPDDFIQNGRRDLKKSRGIPSVKNLVLQANNVHVDGLLRDSGNSIAKALEILQSCTKLSM